MRAVRVHYPKKVAFPLRHGVTSAYIDGAPCAALPIAWNACPARADALINFSVHLRQKDAMSDRCSGEH